MTGISQSTPPEAAPASEERIRDALVRLAAALGPRSGHVVVTAATAKAAEALVCHVEPEMVAYRSVWVSGRTLDTRHLLRAFAVDDSSADSLPGAVRLLAERARSIARPVVIVVADADVVAASELERLRLLVENTSDTPDWVRMVLLGSPALLETLRHPGARALATRVTTWITVPDEVTTASLLATSQLLTEPLRLGGAPGWPRPWRIVTAGVLGAALATSVALLVTPAHVAPPPSEPAPAPANPEPAPEPARVVETVPATPPAPAAVEVDPEPAPPPRAIVHEPSPAVPRGRSIQVGAFRDLANATALRLELANRFEWVMVTEVERDGVAWHRVRIEGLENAAAVDVALATLRRAGYRPIVVRN